MMLIAFEKKYDFRKIHDALLNLKIRKWEVSFILIVMEIKNKTLMEYLKL